jgi:thiamine monophosphate kinase
LNHQLFEKHCEDQEANMLSKTITWQCFGEEFYNLVMIIDVKNIDHFSCLMITNKVILNVNVFGAVMKL